MKKMTRPPMINPRERIELNNFLHLNKWEFETLFLRHCCALSSIYIGKDSSDESCYAVVYGLQAVRNVDNQPCIAKIFVRFSSRLYGARDIVDAAEITKLLTKEATIEQHRREYWELERLKKDSKKRKKAIMRQLHAA